MLCDIDKFTKLSEKEEQSYCDCDYSNRMTLLEESTVASLDYIKILTVNIQQHNHKNIQNLLNVTIDLKFQDPHIPDRSLSPMCHRKNYA